MTTEAREVAPLSLALERRPAAAEHGADRDRHADGFLRRRRLRRQDGLRPVADAGAHRADQEAARRDAQGRLARHAHKGRPSPRPVRPAAQQALALAADRRRHRRSRPLRPHPGARRAGLGDHSRAGAREGRAGHRQAGQGLVLRHRPRADAAHARHRQHRARRHHHRCLRPHHHARGQRPRLRMPRPGGLHRRHRQGQPPGGAEDGRDAGRRVRRRRRIRLP